MEDTLVSYVMQLNLGCHTSQICHVLPTDDRHYFCEIHVLALGEHRQEEGFHRLRDGEGTQEPVPLPLMYVQTRDCAPTNSLPT